MKIPVLLLIIGARHVKSFARVKPCIQLRSRALRSNRLHTQPEAESLASEVRLEPVFEVTGERPAYNGWRTIIHRDVKMPAGSVATFDIMWQPSPSVLVFPWFTQSSTTTLITELAPGDMTFTSGCVAGICEDKHASPLQAGEYELEEEANLHGGTWYSLLEGDGTVSMGKYTNNRSHVYLVIDPVVTANPRPLDLEEFIEIESGVCATEVERRCLSGEMNIHSSYTCLLALDRLRKMGLIPT